MAAGSRRERTGLPRPLPSRPFPPRGLFLARQAPWRASKACQRRRACAGTGDGSRRGRSGQGGRRRQGRLSGCSLRGRRRGGTRAPPPPPSCSCSSLLASKGLPRGFRGASKPARMAGFQRTGEGGREGRAVCARFCGRVGPLDRCRRENHSVPNRSRRTHCWPGIRHRGISGCVQDVRLRAERWTATIRLRGLPATPRILTVVRVHHFLLRTLLQGGVPRAWQGAALGSSYPEPALSVRLYGVMCPKLPGLRARREPSRPHAAICPPLPGRFVL